MSSPVHITIKLSLAPPQTFSISPSKASETLQLTASIRQTASPEPSRSITTLKKFTALDDGTDGAADAFYLKYMKSPTSLEDPNKVIKMYPYEVRVNVRRPNGDLDIRKREHFEFISVPSVESGEAVQVQWQLSTMSMLRYGSKPIEEQLANFNPSERFRITTAADLGLSWWTWGSLDDELRGKKFSRWQLPQDRLDEDVSSRLRDPITFHDVDKLDSRSCVDDEQKPDLERMVEEGWVFSEPQEALNAKCINAEEGAVFNFSE